MASTYTFKLRDILVALKEVTKPYQLGIQLGVDSSELDEIEKMYPRDIDRQKTEVIKYWLCNSPDASWTTLANAMERMGGHAKLVVVLRDEEQTSETTKSSEESGVSSCSLQLHQLSFCTPHHDGSIAAIGLDTCVECDILLLGKMGHGKSTLGNRMVNSHGCFRINNRNYPQTYDGSAIYISASQCKNYWIKIYDHDGLFEGARSVSNLKCDIPKGLNLVIFVLKCGSSFDADEGEIFNSVVHEWKISEISALVLTHCERLSEEERGKMIEEFKNSSLAKLVGKGIFAVGFPDSSHIQPGSELSQRVEKDIKKLRQLICLCDKRVTIPQTRSSWCSIS